MTTTDFDEERGGEVLGYPVLLRPNFPRDRIVVAPADADGGFLIPQVMSDWVPRPGWVAHLVRLVLGERWRWKVPRLMQLGWDEVQVNFYEMLLSKVGRHA